MELEINEGGIWTGNEFISWDVIAKKVVETYDSKNMRDVTAVRGIVEEIRILADDIEQAY